MFKRTILKALKALSLKNLSKILFSLQLFNYY